MRYAVVLLVIVACLGVTTAPTTMPETQSATRAATRPAADHSSPEKTWAGVCEALKAGDLASFRAGFYNRNILSGMFMDAYSDLTVATFDLATATAMLGKEGQQLSPTFAAAYTDLVKTGDDHKSEVKGSMVQWIHEEKTAKGVTQVVIFFKQVKGQWLIDTAQTYGLDSDAGRASAEKLLESLPKVTAALKQISADIRSGKITTVEQMKKRLAAAG